MQFEEEQRDPFLPFLSGSWLPLFPFSLTGCRYLIVLGIEQM